MQLSPLCENPIMRVSVSPLFWAEQAITRRHQLDRLTTSFVSKKIPFWGNIIQGNHYPQQDYVLTTRSKLSITLLLWAQQATTWKDKQVVPTTNFNHPNLREILSYLK